MTLKVAPCSHEAAKYAVLNWHYSEAMPIGKLVRYGVWEDDQYIKVVLYGRGASPALGAPFDLSQTECCELVRVALKEHKSPVSQIVAATLTRLKRDNPGLRLVVSFADPEQGHSGGIYKAGNWIYNGTSPSSEEMLFRGKWTHTRMLRPTGWGSVPKIAQLSDADKAKLPRRKRSGKHRYLYPLDKQMRRRIQPLRLPYPHAVEGSEESRIASGDEGQVRSLPTALG